ncbi:MAG: prephenate dehydrogenase/arogenate dehydrogenase family protein [Acidobacteria bacterium]|nr:prephenate dehydrogenase/arogenate dehydrogenase family protein [Acidobacteriota bacterium]
MTTVAIVGVGLIGGSFALALHRHGFSGRILGVSSARTLATALGRKVIDEGLSLDQAIPQADLVYLAHPVSRILDVLPKVARLARPTALITDAGSTKAAIVARARELFPADGPIFLGGHPMAGKAERGVEVAEAELFQDTTYVLTPTGGVLPESEPVQEFCVWIDKIGARRLVMSPDQHDVIVALTSHLPQLASTALAAVLFERLPSPDAWKAAGGGLRDSTRLARSAYELWRDICLTNSENIDRALSFYIQKLEHLRENLRQPALKEEFERGAAFVAEFQKHQT